MLRLALISGTWNFASIADIVEPANFSLVYEFWVTKFLSPSYP